MINIRLLGALVPSASAASRRSSGSADVAAMPTVQHRGREIVTRVLNGFPINMGRNVAIVCI
jgi:hypothetical protein